MPAPSAERPRGADTRAARPVTLVTGPLRSGTSCVTGLLECCGFDLGRALRVLRDPTEHNARGHFEVDLLFTINHRLCQEVPFGYHDWLRIPERAAMDRLAAARDRYFRLFIDSFDGELCKDPLLCLTWPYWNSRWPALERTVFCLRHPLSVARSMDRRYDIGIPHGLELWRLYAGRFAESVGAAQVYWLDFDVFRQRPAAELGRLLDWLDRPRPASRLRECAAGFFDRALVHHAAGETELETLPADVRALYRQLRDRCARSRAEVRADGTSA